MTQRNNHLPSPQTGRHRSSLTSVSPEPLPQAYRAGAELLCAPPGYRPDDEDRQAFLYIVGVAMRRFRIAPCALSFSGSEYRMLFVHPSERTVHAFVETAHHHLAGFLARHHGWPHCRFRPLPPQTVDSDHALLDAVEWVAQLHPNWLPEPPL
jgi:hypothetical protein